MNRSHDTDNNNNEPFDMYERTEYEMLEVIQYKKNINSKPSSEAMNVISKLGPNVNIIKVFEDNRWESCSRKNITYNDWYLWVIIDIDGVEQFIHFIRHDTHITDKDIVPIIIENSEYMHHEVYDDNAFFELLKIHY
jgi:hypothetical protein